jgi:GT2 family glycosyltransferase
MSMVSIVIPNYNGMPYLDECLKALSVQTYNKFEVILVDNGSIDGSGGYVKKNYPWVQTIILDKNYGFSAAVNNGIEVSSGKFVVLLNTDTSAEVQWLQHLVDCISTDERIFSCSSKMVQYSNRHLIDDAGDGYTAIGWAYQIGHGRPSNLYSKKRRIFSACAGAGIYRKELLEKIGKFDETFFAYLEDVDIGFRASIEGYLNVFCPKAVISHIGSATSGGGLNPFKIKLSARNNVYLIYKNMPVGIILLNLPFLILGFLLRCIFFKQPDHREAYWSGLKEGIKTFRNVRKTNFKLINSINYAKIQIRIWTSTAIYLWNKTIQIKDRFRED